MLGLSDAVDAGHSRCGICNGADWQTLRAAEVPPGQVPPAVLASVPIFYRCGCCQQMFWPGDKYENTMDGLRAETAEQQQQQPAAPATIAPRAGTAGAVWRQPSGTVDGQPSPATLVGKQMRAAGTLHSTQRMQLSVGGVGDPAVSGSGAHMMTVAKHKKGPGWKVAPVETAKHKSARGGVADATH